MLIDNTHEVLTDDLLKKAFNDYFDRVLEQTPSDEELAKKYPYPESSYEKVFAAYKAQKRRALIWLKSAGRVAIIALIVASLTFGVLMTNTNIRAAVSSFFIRDKGDHWQIDFINGEEFSPETEEVIQDEEKEIKESPADKFEIRYVPEGFELDEYSNESEKVSYKYTDSNADSISINICRREDLENLDYLTYENMMATPFVGYYKELDDGKSRLLVMERSDYAVFVETTLDVEALKKIARNIREIIDFESEEYKNSPVYKFEIGYIPKGFELDLDLYRPNSLHLSYYKNGTIPLSISITKKGTTTYGVDNERTTHSILTVNGQEAQMWYNYEEGCGTLLVAYEECVVKVFACDTPEEIIKIAENIKPKAPK